MSEENPIEEITLTPEQEATQAELRARHVTLFDEHRNYAKERAHHDTFSQMCICATGRELIKRRPAWRADCVQLHADKKAFYQEIYA